MGCEKAGLVVVLLFLTLKGLLTTQSTRVRSAPDAEIPQKTLTADYSCDFDNANRPFCDWSQTAESQGSLWIPAQGQKPGESPGPPEEDIARRDNYIHPGTGGFAQLESPEVDPAGAEVCVRFLYYLYSLSQEGQLSIEIRNASGSDTPLWSREGLQSTSWLSGAVTVPAQTPRPFKVVFKGKQVSTGDITVALDSILIRPGPCSPCKTKCDFDTFDDLCGWSNPGEGDVIWTQWTGPTEMPGVGPSDDFSRPGCEYVLSKNVLPVGAGSAKVLSCNTSSGFFCVEFWATWHQAVGSFMLLDSFDGKPGNSSLKSPAFSSGGCLLLTFFYTLHGVSDDTALKIYAAPPGGDLGVPLLTLKGEHGPSWRAGFANYTGKEDIQFVFEGVYAGKPGLAVDNVAVSPCEDIFASCDFNNNTDPFCGWSESVNDTWQRTNRNTPTEDTGPPGDYPHGEGYYIYVEGGHLKPNESTRFSSSPFCMNQEACVEFYYHMHSVVEVETQLRVLLEGPSGGAVLLWDRTGTQSPNWLHGSVTLPYTGAQPSKVTFEVIRGSNAYLDVSLDNILVHQGYCAAHPPTTVPPRPISTASTTSGGPVVSVPQEQSTISWPTMMTSSRHTMSSASIATKSTGTTAQSNRPVPVTTSTPVITRNESLATTAVPSVTDTTTALPNITIHSGTTATPKLTTSLQPSTGTSTPSRPSSPSSTTSQNSTAQGTLTTTSGPPSTAIHSNITVTTGTTATPVTPSAAIHPNITGTTATPITPSAAIHPNVTGTTATPITPSTAIHPNVTGTTATPVTPSAAIHPNVTGITPTPVTPSAAIHPNVTGTTATPVTPSAAIHPNVTGTTATPVTPSAAIHPNVTGTTATPVTPSAAIHPNVTGITPTPVTPSAAIHPNVTGTTATPVTPSAAIHPNVTGTTATPVTPSAAIHPNVTGTTATPVTPSAAIHPNVTGITPTPVTPSAAIHPNVTGTTATPVTPSAAIHPNVTGTTATPVTPSAAIHPNVTGTTATPVTPSAAIHPNVTGTTATPVTPSAAIHPNVTGITPTPVTPSAAIHPNVTGTTATPITPSAAIHPNVTGTTATPITPSAAIHPNITVTTGTTDTPITPSTAITVTTGTTATPITPSTAIHPNITIPPGTSTTSKSAQSSGSTTTQPLQTDSVDTPKPTSKRPGVDQTTPGLPPDSASCIVSGDPHYTTYDGRLFHFMGNCTYLLTATCNATPGQPTFHIQTTNEHRGSNTQVSYLKSINVTVYGTQIVLLKGRRVTVDGKRVTLPVSVAGGRVSVRLSGTFVRMQTDFDLVVRFDGNHHAEVSVPSSYFGKLCGLCGNFNGQLEDDNLMPNGTSAGADANQLGKSWQIPNTGDASCTDSKEPEKCNPEIAGEVQGTARCKILTDPQGPFAPCHDKVPPEGAFENCFYDLCETGGDTGMLCFALQAYADRCAQAGVSITWRNRTFCPLNCPPGSSYTHCGPACPATCLDIVPENDCLALPCVEGCVCDQGSVLSGEQCVPISQCGCTDADGHYHVVGDIWMADPNCTQRCSCAADNQITCEEWSCSPVQECRPVEGLLGCQDTGVATCQVAGDPHYYTFDGKMVSFMGTCTYTLVALCKQDPRLPLFNITAKNEERGQPEASYLRHVTVYVQGVTITLQKSRRVLIDGQRVRLPVEDRIPGVSIVPSGIYVVIETDFGLVVKFDGNHHLEIQLPGTYFGKVCGMCGNFNNQSADDYLMPNGQQAANDIQFGNSWESSWDSDASCQPDNRPDLNPSCSGQELEHLSGLCLEIMAPKYQACHSLVDPKLFFQNCLYDMCQYQGMPSVLCDNLQAYVEACKSHGVTGISWRNSTFCPLPCPPNSHFSECASPCPSTCTNLYAPASCRHPTACVEGCDCDRDYVLSDLTCVPLWQCGCLDPQQEYHHSGDTWVTSGCQQRCTCLGGQIRCQPFSCQTESQCTTSNEGLHYCRPTRFHQCVILGDPHYRTFDNFVHHFQGRCTYTLTKTLGRIPEGLEPLFVAGRNHRRSILHRVSFLREVYVEVLGFRLTLMQGRKMAVNGVMVTPPYSPVEGLQITQSSQRLIVQTNFGFSISYDGLNSAEIVLPSTYQHRVGGLCGNYDGRRNNEYMKPDGTLARTLNAFGNSWEVKVKRKELDLAPVRVRRQEPEEEPETGFEMDCTPDQLALVNGTTACGALSDPAGPFSACHAVVSPFPFQESCIFDLCALLNDTELLCQDLEAYAQLCQEQKVDLGPWRQKMGCAMACPAHTSYQPCMTACPASCANPAAPSNCEAPCVEGCASIPGYVLSGLVSVPYYQCGCSSNGQYYQINETFMTEDCSQRCTCQATDILDCSPARCGPGEICAVSGYVRSCFQDNACLSSPCQNEGTCQVTPAGFQCLCLEGYIGSLCEDSPLESSTPAPSKTSSTSATSTSATSQALPDVSQTTTAGDPQGPDLLAILLGVFIPLAVILLALIIFCFCRQRNHGYKMKLEEDHISVISTSGFGG